MTTLRCSRWNARASPTARPSTATRSSSRWAVLGVHGSIERKHQNISSVMLQLGLPYIMGYKPLPNIQEALRLEVRRRLEADPGWFAELQPQPQSPAEARFGAALRQVTVPEMPPEPRGRKVDYGLLQEESKRVGDRGEEFVFNFEKATLEREGRADLAADVLLGRQGSRRRGRV